VDDIIDRAQDSGGIGQSIQVLDDMLFVRVGDVETGEPRGHVFPDDFSETLGRVWLVFQVNEFVLEVFQPLGSGFSTVKHRRQRSANVFTDESNTVVLRAHFASAPWWRGLPSSEVGVR